jgi:uncharacterized protein (DUF1778 family)
MDTNTFVDETRKRTKLSMADEWTCGDKMTPHTYTECYQPLATEETAMLAHTGKRLTTRITDHVQAKLQAAADLVGATLNQFVVQAALEKAEKVIESESTIVLTRRESLRLLEMIENPPPRNEKFLQAQARYQRLKNGASSTA